MSSSWANIQAANRYVPTHPYAAVSNANVLDNNQSVDQIIQTLITQNLNSNSNRNPARNCLAWSVGNNREIFGTILTLSKELIEYFINSKNILFNIAATDAVEKVCEIMAMMVTKSNPSVYREMGDFLRNAGFFIDAEVVKMEQEFQSIKTAIIEFKSKVDVVIPKSFYSETVTKPSTNYNAPNVNNKTVKEVSLSSRSADTLTNILRSNTSYDKVDEMIIERASYDDILFERLDTGNNRFIIATINAKVKKVELNIEILRKVTKEELVNYEEHETVKFFRNTDIEDRERLRDYKQTVYDFDKLNKERSAQIIISEHDNKYGINSDAILDPVEINCAIKYDKDIYVSGDLSMALLSLRQMSFKMVGAWNSHVLHFKYTDVKRIPFKGESAVKLIELTKSKTMDDIIFNIVKCKKVFTTLQWSIVSGLFIDRINHMLKYELSLDISIESMIDDFKNLKEYLSKEYGSFVYEVFEKNIGSSIDSILGYIPHDFYKDENGDFDGTELVDSSDMDFTDDFGGHVGKTHEVILLQAMSTDMNIAYTGANAMLTLNFDDILYSVIKDLVDKMDKRVYRLEFHTKDEKVFYVYRGLLIKDCIFLHIDE